MINSLERKQRNSDVLCGDNGACGPGFSSEGIFSSEGMVLAEEMVLGDGVHQDSTSKFIYFVIFVWRADQNDERVC